MLTKNKKLDPVPSQSKSGAAKIFSFVRLFLILFSQAVEKWADYPPPSGADVKSVWSLISSSPHVFISWS